MTDHDRFSRAQAFERVVAALYDFERLDHPEWPTLDTPDASDMRMDLRYRLTGAVRRGIHSVRMVAIERVAAALATLDGETYPACDLHVSPNWKEGQRAALIAQRRQKYRHKAVQVIAAFCGYMEVEHPQETEESRALIVEQAKSQHTADAHVSAAWRDQIGMPSTVPQLGEVPQ